MPARRIREIYSTNHFMNDYFHIDIETIRCGEVTVAMMTDPAIHTNHRGVIHGGVFAALFDAVTGVTSCTLGGAMAVTTNMTIDYIRNVAPRKTHLCDQQGPPRRQNYHCHGSKNDRRRWLAHGKYDSHHADP